MCADALENEKIGGPGKTVEIDNSLFLFNNDHRKNRQPITCRVFGGVEVESSKSFVVYLSVYASSMESLIVKHILPGTTICCQRREGFENIANLKSPEGVSMNYSVKFSSHQHRLCDQLWHDLKENIRRRGLQRQSIENYIKRYMFYRKYPVDTLHHFLLQVGLSYPFARADE